MTPICTVVSYHGYNTNILAQKDIDNTYWYIGTNTDIMMQILIK